MNIKSLLEHSFIFSALATMGNEAIYQERQWRGRQKMDLPNNPKKVIPKGCKVWHEYGGVIALNEASAKRKYEKLKSK